MYLSVYVCVCVSMCGLGSQFIQLVSQVRFVPAYVNVCVRVRVTQVE